MVRLPDRDGRVDPAAALAHLNGMQINEVLVEAGPTLQGALMAARLVDEVTLYLAPHLMGSTGLGMFDLPAVASMDDRVALAITDVTVVGDDLRITARPVRN